MSWARDMAGMCLYWLGARIMTPQTLREVLSNTCAVYNGQDGR